MIPKRENKRWRGWKKRTRVCVKKGVKEEEGKEMK